MTTWRDLSTALEWRPIRGCPGRYALRGGRSDRDPAALVAEGRAGQEYHIAGVRDPVVVVPLAEGGLLSYRHEDGTWTHTLGDTDGFGRKLARLGLNEHLVRAEFARERGDLAEAHRRAEAATMSGDARAWGLLASIAHLEGALDEAARHYRRALALAPEDAAAHAGLAVLLTQRGQVATARAHAAAALAGGGLGTVPWLRTLRQSRELEGATAETVRPWERCATPPLAPRGPSARVLPPAAGLVAWSPEDLAAALREGPRVVALTGAGISASSGLQTRKELWRRFVRDDAVSAVRFREEPRTLWEVVRAFWGEGEHPPNPAHVALAALPGLAAIVTQNVDDLHQAAARAVGRSTPVVELHGSLSRTACVACGRPDKERAQTLAARDPLPPRCPTCGGVLRPDVVLFGEAVPARAWAEARAWVERAEILLVIGCAMDVSPASELPPLAAAAGARIVEIKRRPSGLATVAPVFHVAGAAEVVLPAILATLELEGRHAGREG